MASIMLFRETVNFVLQSAQYRNWYFALKIVAQKPEDCNER